MSDGVSLNPFRRGEGEKRGVVPAALAGFWISLIALIAWGLIGATLGIHNGLVRVLAVIVGSCLTLDGLMLLFGLGDATNRTVAWLRAGGSTALSRQAAAYWRLYGLLLAGPGAAILFRSLFPWFPN